MQGFFFLNVLEFIEKYWEICSTIYLDNCLNISEASTNNFSHVFLRWLKMMDVSELMLFMIVL